MKTRTAWAIVVVAAALAAFILPALASNLTVTFHGLGVGVPVSGTYTAGGGGTLTNQDAGTMRMTIQGEGAERIGYCIDIRRGITSDDVLTQDTWEESTVGGLANVTYILRSFDYRDAGWHADVATATQVTDAMRAGAIQAAIWHFTDGFTLTGVGAGVDDEVFQALYEHIKAQARDSDNLAGIEEPGIDLHIDPSDMTALKSGAAGPFVVGSSIDGPATLTATNGARIVANPGDTTTIAEVTVSGGVSDPFYVEYVDQNGVAVEVITVTAEARTSYPSGLVFTAADTQSLILADRAETLERAEATARFVDPASVSVTIGKQWEGVEDPDLATPTRFTVTLLRGEQQIDTQQIDAGQSASFADLLPGDYTIAWQEQGESVPGMVDGCVFDGSPATGRSDITLVAGEVASEPFTAVNTYACPEAVAAVSKSWENVDAPAGGASFLVSLFDADADDQPVGPAIAIATATTTQTATFTQLIHGQRYVLHWQEQDIPAIVDGCALDAANSITEHTQAFTASGPDAPQRFSFDTATNVYRCPEVSIDIDKTWTIDGAPAEVATPTTFTVTLYEYDGALSVVASTTVTTDAGQRVDFDDEVAVNGIYRIAWAEDGDRVPPALGQCVFDEAASRDLTGTTPRFRATVDGPVPLDEPASLHSQRVINLDTDADFTVEAINAYACADASIAITKTWINVDDPGEVATPTFALTLTELDADGAAVASTTIDTLGADEVVTFDELTVGATYRVEVTEREESIPASLQGCTFTRADIGTALFTAVAGQTAEVTVSATNVYTCPTPPGPPPPPPPLPPSVAQVSVAKLWQWNLDTPIDAGELTPTFTIELVRDGTIVDTAAGVGVDDTVEFTDLVVAADYTLRWSEDADSIPATLGSGCAFLGSQSTTSGTASFTAALGAPVAVDLTATNRYECPDVAGELTDDPVEQPPFDDPVDEPEPMEPDDPPADDATDPDAPVTDDPGPPVDDTEVLGEQEEVAAADQVDATTNRPLPRTGTDVLTLSLLGLLLLVSGMLARFGRRPTGRLR